LDFQGFAIGITSQEMPDNLTEEADFTLNRVDDVESFLKWLSQTAVELIGMSYFFSRESSGTA